MSEVLIMGPNRKACNFNDTLISDFMLTYALTLFSIIFYKLEWVVAELVKPPKCHWQVCLTPTGFIWDCCSKEVLMESKRIPCAYTCVNHTCLLYCNTSCAITYHPSSDLVLTTEAKMVHRPPPVLKSRKGLIWWTTSNQHIKLQIEHHQCWVLEVYHISCRHSWVLWDHMSMSQMQLGDLHCT